MPRLGLIPNNHWWPTRSEWEDVSIGGIWPAWVKDASHTIYVVGPHPAFEGVEDYAAHLVDPWRKKQRVSEPLWMNFGLWHEIGQVGGQPSLSVGRSK